MLGMRSYFCLYSWSPTLVVLARLTVGKIYDIFDGEGLTESNKSKSSVHGMEQTIEIAGRDFTGLCFVNLVDFDALWGHRRNPEGYAEELEKFDVKLGELLSLLKEDDLLLITADHGNDPTTPSSDHNREYVPLLILGGGVKDIGTRKTMADIGATVYSALTGTIREDIPGENVL